VGQAFRWTRSQSGAWIGVVRGRALRVWLESGLLLVQAVPEISAANLDALVRHYFWLELDARTFQQSLARAHPLAAAAVDSLPGLRVIRQEFDEAALSFSIASATNVPRIARCIANICDRFGAPITRLDGVDYRAFPTATAILGADPAMLAGPC